MQSILFKNLKQIKNKQYEWRGWERKACKMSCFKTRS